MFLYSIVISGTEDEVPSQPCLSIRETSGYSIPAESSC